MEKETESRLREAIMIENHGQPEDQKNALVDFILDSFQDPEKWPMLDEERIALLRRFYSAASIIRCTEEVIRQSTKQPQAAAGGGVKI